MKPPTRIKSPSKKKQGHTPPSPAKRPSKRQKPAVPPVESTPPATSTVQALKEVFEVFEDEDDNFFEARAFVEDPELADEERRKKVTYHY